MCKGASILPHLRHRCQGQPKLGYYVAAMCIYIQYHRQRVPSERMAVVVLLMPHRRTVNAFITAGYDTH
eukprot:COSAG01_NODE_10102_length_2251_cov_1.504182_3_plen_69_part_00